MDQSEEKKHRFDELGLSPVMLAALEKATYEYPTPVQSGLIPRALAGVDVVGQARTGTGKTASFAIPILEKMVLNNRDIHHVQALVMVPTRELAVQVHDEIVKLSHGRRVHCVAVYGGKPIRGQIEKLNKGAQVVVGTPGRVLDHLARGTINLSMLKIAVLDEADRMLDIGFRPDIEKILRRCPAERQTLLLSATVPPPIARIAQKYMRSPETLNFTSSDLTVETIDQYYFT
ncbi:MAG: DEAD/DEAH box helicase, partial [Pirellulaceae bacterium]